VEATDDLVRQAGLLAILADGEIELDADPRAWQALDGVGWALADERSPVGGPVPGGVEASDRGDALAHG
jgi:hypothetical protein